MRGFSRPSMVKESPSVPAEHKLELGEQLLQAGGIDRPWDTDVETGRTAAFDRTQVITAGNGHDPQVPVIGGGADGATQLDAPEARPLDIDHYDIWRKPLDPGDG